MTDSYKTDSLHLYSKQSRIFICITVCAVYLTDIIYIEIWYKNEKKSTFFNNK